MKNLGGFLIGAGITIGLGYLIHRQIKKSKIGSGQEQPTDTGTKPTGGKPSGSSETGFNQASITGSAISGKSVRSVLLNTPQGALLGKPVYAIQDGTKVYTTLNMLYTTAKKGQLLGVFAGATAIKDGGYWVNIKTTSQTDPYVKTIDGLLKF